MSKLRLLKKEGKDFRCVDCEELHPNTPENDNCVIWRDVEDMFPKVCGGCVRGYPVAKVIRLQGRQIQDWPDSETLKELASKH